eukprot:388902_1
MCNQTHQLFTIDQVPRFLRYNYYIRSGYRPPPDQTSSNTYHLISSIFSWHNESINIWTHLFALIMFGSLLIYELCFRNTRYCIAITCIACVITFSGSIMYHSTMNKCVCQSQYKQCLNYDVVGVICACTFTGISPIYNGYKCNYNIFVMSALVILMCSLCYTSIKMLSPDATAKIRGKYLGMHAMLRTILALSMVSGNILWQINRYQSLKWHGISFILLIVGGLINVSRYPEKLFVNKYVSSFFLVNRNELKNKMNGEYKARYSELLDFIRYSIDFIGNSHQIWHMFVIFTCVTCYYGCVWDYIYSINTVCSNDNLYDLVNRTGNIMYDNINQIDDESKAMYAVAHDILFEPKFVYPF